MQDQVNVNKLFEIIGKETVQKILLSEQNEQLRQENEKIKNLYDEQVKQGSSDHDVS